MKNYSLILFFLLGSLTCLAQPNNPTNPVPIDGGLSLLVLGGSLYAAKRIRQQFLKNNDPKEE